MSAWLHAPTLRHLFGIALPLCAAALGGCAEQTDEPDAALRPTGCLPPSDPDELPGDLAATGCMDSARPTELAAFIVPYEVNSPLWSDGADKLRGVRLPQGGTIRVADDGKWELPVGTVLVKSFGFDNKLVETRLFARMSDEQWLGYTYQWNSEQTEAKLVPDDRVTVSFDTGKRSVEWTYPNRFDCMKCHNAIGGSSLGLETSQLNRTVAGQNQIDRLVARKLFEQAPAKPYATALVTPYKDQAGEPPASASVETRIRSYMHANCAFCHRPDSDFPSLDLRFDVSFRDTHLCGSTPLKGDVGVANATNLTPGEPMLSTAWLRVAAKPNEGRMPQIGTARVDTQGLELMGDWIRSIESCP